MFCNEGLVSNTQRSVDLIKEYMQRKGHMAGQEVETQEVGATWALWVSLWEEPLSMDTPTEAVS